jgi:hypothetical protein
MWDTNKKYKNSVELPGGLVLNCLCAEHKKDSTCEVYLRQEGKWKEPTEEENRKLLEDIKKELEKQLRVVPYPVYPLPIQQWPGGTWRCPYCGVYSHYGSSHHCWGTVGGATNVYNC